MSASLPAGLEQPAVLPEAQRCASQDEHDRHARKHERDRVHVNLRCRDEHARRNQSAHDGRTQQGSILELDPRDAPGPLPGSESNQDDRERPGEVDVRALDVRAHRNLVEVDGVAHDIEQEPGCDQGPGAPGTPARDREDEDDEGEQEHVADRIRHVRQTTSRLPCVELTTTSTSTEAPSAAAAVAATSPSSQRVALKVETRRRSKSTIPT